MGSYARSLLLELGRQGLSSSITLFTDTALQDLDAEISGMFSISAVSGPGGSIGWEQAWVPRSTGKHDLIHCPANAAPLRAPCPVIVTLHDAIFVRKLRDISRFTYPRQVIGHVYRKNLYPMAARRASAVITVSEASRVDISAVMHVPRERITVTGEALPDSFRDSSTTPSGEVRTRFGIPGDFLLALGAYEKRKNIPMLLEAFRGVKTATGRIPRLVLVGAENLRASGYHREIIRLGLQERVLLLPFVGDGELKGLYSCASAFLFPSRKEGFGLPILEAMACGAPVLSADIPSSRETAGSAAVLLPVDDVPAWTGAMSRALDDREWSAALSGKGKNRAAEFSWGPVAEKTRAVYEAVAGKD